MYQKDYLYDPVIPFDGELLCRYERKGLQITGEWAADIHNLLTYFGYDRSPVELAGGCLLYDIDVVDSSCPFTTGRICFKKGRGTFHIYEKPVRVDSPCIFGVLLEAAPSEPDRTNLRDLYALLMLNTVMVPLQLSPCPVIDVPSDVATRVAILFERELLLKSTNRKGWNQIGMLNFIDKATFWIRRCVPIQMALPAFPCKTTNSDKAAASVPDGGEFEALVNLSSFCRQVEAIYRPGCFIEIVSDGHVFSDCIGTDDAIVTEYSMRLKEMLKEVHRQYPVERGGIEFLDLETLLNLKSDRIKAAMG